MAQKNTTHEYNVSPLLNQLVIIWAKLWPSNNHGYCRKAC